MDRRPLLIVFGLVIIGLAVALVARTRGPGSPADPSRASPRSPSTDPSDCDVSVDSGGDIQAASNSALEGAIICLTGSYDIAQPIRPRTGQTFVGPASITGSVHTGFELKGTESGVDAEAADVTLIDLDIWGFELRAIECWEGTTVIGGRLHHNGRNGLGCGLEYARGHILVENVEVDHNGSPDELGRGAGGMKFARLGPDGLTVRDSHIHDNVGNGVWCDVQCIGTFLIEGNVIETNGRKGVHYEKSGASDEYMTGQIVEGRAIIRNNVVTGNGTEGREHAADGGIVGVSSRNMLIEGNTVSDNHRAGIVLTTDGRLTGVKHGWTIEAVVRNEDGDDGIVGCDAPGVTCR